MSKTRAQLIGEIASLKITYDQEKREYDEAKRLQTTGNSQSSEVGLTDPDETTGNAIRTLETELAERFPGQGGRRRRTRSTRHRRKHRKTRSIARRR